MFDHNLDSLTLMRDIRVPIDGGEINVWHRPGEHTPTLLIHGLTGNSRWWSKVIEQLPEDQTLMSVDVRGRGLSVETPPPYDMESMADDVAVVLDQFGIATATVAGYSMGAWIAAVFGERHPDRVERLILVDGGLEVPSPPDMKPDEIIDAVVGPALARLELVFDDREAFVTYWQSHPALRNYWTDDMAGCLDLELQADGDSFRAHINAQATNIGGRDITVRPELSTAVFRQTTPIHILVVERGTSDQDGGMIPLESAKEAANQPNITFEFVEDVNHYTLMLGKGAPAVAAAINPTR